MVAILFMENIFLILLKFTNASQKKLSFKAKNFSELKKIIFKFIKKEQNNKKKVNKFKKIGKNILAKNFKEIRVLI